MVPKPKKPTPKKPIETTAKASEGLHEQIAREGMKIRQEYIDLEHKLRVSALERYLSRDYADMNVLFIHDKPYLVIIYRGPAELEKVSRAIRNELDGKSIEVQTNEKERKIYIHKRAL